MADEMDFTIPLPNGSTEVKLEKWKAGVSFDRIHRAAFRAAVFNPGFRDARFSSFTSADGSSVPTMYAGENVSVAVMKTVFHDISLGCAGVSFDMEKLTGLVRSTLAPLADFFMVKITPMTMKKWGITQAELLGSEATQYNVTRRWVTCIHKDNPKANGIVWPSKQHGGTALMLFGDRTASQDIEVWIESEPVETSVEVRQTIEDLADEMELVLLDKEL